jgi:hypothetical protein
MKIHPYLGITGKDKMVHKEERFFHCLSAADRAVVPKKHYLKQD